MSVGEIVLTLLGMAAVTLVSRGFFLFPRGEPRMPAWLLQGLRYAPLAALTAVVAPEIVLTQGRLVTTLQDARIWAAAVGAGYYFWRGGILGMIVSGTSVMLALRLGLGW